MKIYIKRYLEFINLINVFINKSKSNFYDYKFEVINKKKEKLKAI